MYITYISQKKTAPHRHMVSYGAKKCQPWTCSHRMTARIFEPRFSRLLARKLWLCPVAGQRNITAGLRFFTIFAARFSGNYVFNVGQMYGNTLFGIRMYAILMVIHNKTINKKLQFWIRINLPLTTGSVMGNMVEDHGNSCDEPADSGTRLSHKKRQPFKPTIPQ